MAELNTITPAAAQKPAVNVAAVSTLTAPPAGHRWVISGLIWSYDSTPTGGSIVIAWTGGSMTIYIPAAGPGQFQFPTPLRLPTDVAATITLAAGGSSCTGSVYPQAWTE